LIVIKILFAILVIGVFSGLAFTYQLESSDGEMYKVKIGKHHKSREKVCWSKDCSWNRDTK